MSERKRRGLLPMGLGIGLLWLNSGSATAEMSQTWSAEVQPPADVKVLSHDVDYFVDTEAGTVEVTEQIQFDHGEEGYPAAISFPRHVQNEDKVYAIDYSDWIVARVDIPSKDTELQMNPVSLRLLLSEEGELTGKQGYVITYTLENAFYAPEEGDVRLTLSPAQGWEHEVSSSTATVYGLPGATDILCEDACQYEPKDDAQLFSKEGGPMSLEIQFPADSGVEANAEEVDPAELVPPTVSSDSSAPSQSETADEVSDETPKSIGEAWQKIPVDAKLFVGAILVGGVIALIISRFLFTRSLNRK